MQDLFKILLVMHIAGGTAGLISGTIAAAVIKGKKAHIFAGKIFSIGMIIAALSALIMSNLPDHHNIFLFAVGGFTFYMVTTGNRIVQLKKNKTVNTSIFNGKDYFLFLFGTVFGLFLIFIAVKTYWINKNMFALVPIVFGLICLNYARMDFSLLSGKSNVQQQWLYNHITRMMGALIASYTAFLVVNVQIKQQWVFWLLPTLTGSFLIAYFIRKFIPKRNIIH